MRSTGDLGRDAETGSLSGKAAAVLQGWRWAGSSQLEEVGCKQERVPIGLGWSLVSPGTISNPRLFFPRRDPTAKVKVLPAWPFRGTSQKSFLAHRKQGYGHPPVQTTYSRSSCRAEFGKRNATCTSEMSHHAGTWAQREEQDPPIS